MINESCYLSERQIEKRKNKDYLPDGFSNTKLFILWKIANPETKLTAKKMAEVYKVLDDIVLEECLKGTRVTLPSNVGTLSVALTSNPKFYNDKVNDLYRRRINGGATRARKKELLAIGDTTTDPTVYFQKDFYLSWKLRRARMYHSTKLLVLRNSIFYKFAPCREWANRLKQLSNTMSKEEAINTFGIYVKNKIK